MLGSVASWQPVATSWHSSRDTLADMGSQAAFDPRVVDHLFATRPGYLDAAALGLPFHATLTALREHLDAWEAGNVRAPDFDPLVERAREAYAQIVGAEASQVAIGSQTSVQVSVVAQALPPRARVVTVEGEFTSVTYPFLARGDLDVVAVPLDALAESITPGTALVAFALVQSADGRIADAEAIHSRAEAAEAMTLCDLTQAAGVVPCRADDWDVTVCHTYKWLSCPRGLSFLTVTGGLLDELAPVQAGWFAGQDRWASTYGHEPALAASARRFDVSPAWPSVAGSVPVLEWFAATDIASINAHAVGLADSLAESLGLPRRGQPIVTWSDPDGRDLQRLRAGGVIASGRAGRVRAAFHLWNSDEDVDVVRSVLER